MKLNEALNEIERYMTQMKFCTSSSGRRYNEKCILSIMRECPATLRYWNYDGNIYGIEERFSRVKIKNEEESTIEIINGRVSDSTITERNAPKEAGLYFIGNCAFNPHTNEKQFWVKIGKTDSTIKKRIRTYDTYCPSIYHIDYLPCNNPSEEEKIYHEILRKNSLAQSATSEEWWLVNEENYLRFCKNGFKDFVF